MRVNIFMVNQDFRSAEKRELKCWDFSLNMGISQHNNKLPNNLPQLQNLIKRDPGSYKDEV